MVLSMDVCFHDDNRGFWIVGMKKVLLISGVNLSMLGVGCGKFNTSYTLSELERHVVKEARALDMSVKACSSNSEAEIIGFIHNASLEAVDAILINAGSYASTSFAILDALRAKAIPYYTVSLWDDYASVLEGGAKGVANHEGLTSYTKVLKMIKSS